jgi:hypothetical protein
MLCPVALPSSSRSPTGVFDRFTSRILEFLNS